MRDRSRVGSAHGACGRARIALALAAALAQLGWSGFTGVPSTGIRATDASGHRVVAITHNPVSAAAGAPAYRAQPGLPANPDDRDLRVVYLGTGGFYIERRYGAVWEGVLTAPFFTHTSLMRLGFGDLGSDPAQVDALPRLVPPDALRRVRAVLAGHAHHDHILDLPTVLTAWATAASVYGNASMANLLEAALPGKRCVAIAGDQVRRARDQPVTWLPQIQPGAPPRRIRFTAIASSHAPNLRSWWLGPLWRFDYVRGEVPDLRDALPLRPRGWKVGQTLAFAIDFMNEADTTQVEYRVYYQDTPHRVDAVHDGMLFPRPQDRRKVDLAIACAATANFVDGYVPSLVTSVRADDYILGHWEDFFRPYTRDPKDLRAVSVTNPETVIDAFQAQGVTHWVLPTPGTQLLYRTR